MSPPPVSDAVAATSLHAPQRSLGESWRSVAVPKDSRGWRRFAAFAGPGYLVAVGYMDPGNWATGLAGGSAFGYTLLSVVLISNLMAMVLQTLTGRLGIVAGMDLAQACRAHYGRKTNFALWALCQLAIIACDLAEVLGTAIALQLLFGLPLVWGVALTALDVMLILMLQNRGFRRLEAFIVALLIVISLCFIWELAVAQPSIAAIAGGFLPSPQIVTDPAKLYLAVGILGATVMPHNLYLHSAVVQTRDFGDDVAAKRDATKWATIDVVVALSLALFVNAAILILSAAAFHTTGQTEVADIDEAYRLLAPTLGAGAAGVVFAIALLASGQNSTVTGTLAGQIVAEGFLGLKLKPWVSRITTRMAAIIPAAIVVGLNGESGATQLLVLSQVVLSMQLPFAIVPLLKFTQDRKLMGEFASGPVLKWTAWAIAAVIIGLNVNLLVQFVV